MIPRISCTTMLPARWLEIFQGRDGLLGELLIGEGVAVANGPLGYVVGYLIEKAPRAANDDGKGQ